MQEIVIALLLIVNGEIKEHRIQDSMSHCLKGKRIASRGTSKNIEYQKNFKSVGSISLDFSL